MPCKFHFVANCIDCSLMFRKGLVEMNFLSKMQIYSTYLLSLASNHKPHWGVKLNKMSIKVEMFHYEIRKKIHFWVHTWTIAGSNNYLIYLNEKWFEFNLICLTLEVEHCYLSMDTEVPDFFFILTQWYAFIGDNKNEMPHMKHEQSRNVNGFRFYCEHIWIGGCRQLNRCKLFNYSPQCILVSGYLKKKHLHQRSNTFLSFSPLFI